MTIGRGICLLRPHPANHSGHVGGSGQKLVSGWWLTGFFAGPAIWGKVGKPLARREPLNKRFAWASSLTKGAHSAAFWS